MRKIRTSKILFLIMLIATALLSRLSIFPASAASSLSKPRPSEDITYDEKIIACVKL